MAQLTIYIDQDTIRKIEDAAAESKVSVSRWVRETVEAALKDQWHPSLSRFFGALAGADLEEPEELEYHNDVPRDTI